MSSTTLSLPLSPRRIARPLLEFGSLDEVDDVVDPTGKNAEDICGDAGLLIVGSVGPGRGSSGLGPGTLNIDGMTALSSKEGH